jgi:hypothetical protein
MKNTLTVRHVLLSTVVLAIAACRSVYVPYAPVKNQGIETAVVDPMNGPMPMFNGLRYRWGGAKNSDSFQIVVDLNAKKMAWSRRSYQFDTESSDLTGVKYQNLTVAQTNRIVSAANALWESESPLQQNAASNIPSIAGDFTLYAAGSVLETCCTSSQSDLGSALREAVLDAFSQP